MSCHGMSAWVVFGLATLPFLTMRVLQVRFHDDIERSSLARAIYASTGHLLLSFDSGFPTHTYTYIYIYIYKCLCLYLYLSYLIIYKCAIFHSKLFKKNMFKTSKHHRSEDLPAPAGCRPTPRHLSPSPPGGDDPRIETTNKLGLSLKTSMTYT